MIKYRQIIQLDRESVAVISLVFAFALFALMLGNLEIMVMFLGYGVILFQSRISLWNLIYGFPGAPIITRLLRSVVFLLPLPILGWPQLNTSEWGIPVGLAFGGICLSLRIPELQFALSREFTDIMPPISKLDRFRDIFHPMLGAIVQEYFYKGVMLYILRDHIGLWSILVAALFFALEHIVQPNASQMFDNRDKLFHLLLGVGLGAIFYFSESLAGCMLGHLIYNSPAVLQVIRRRSLN